MSWSRIDDHWWIDVAARLPRPFARTDALMDLRVHAGQVLRYHQTGGREGRPRLPSRRELAERWGWTDPATGRPQEKRVRLLLQSDDWKDPHLTYLPLFGATTEEAEGQKQGANIPESQQRGASPKPSKGQARLESSLATTLSEPPPTPPPESADLSHLQGLQIAPGVSRSAIGPQQAEFWRALTCGPAPAYPGKKITRDRLKYMNLVLRRFGPDALPQLARWALSDHPTARFLRGTGNPDAVLVNAERYLEEATPAAPPRPLAVWERQNPDPIEDTSTPDAARTWAAWKAGTLHEAITRIREQGGKMPELRAWLALRVSHPEQVIAHLHAEKKDTPQRVYESPRVLVERRIL